VNTSSQRSPLAAVLAFTALSNLATGVATIGVFFLAESAFGFTTAQNYKLGLITGVTYALAAWKSGPILALLARRGAGLSGRGALAAMTAAMAALCLLPYLVQARWTLYVFAALYMPITGVFWSLVESFLSGGRRGEDLRRAISHFNVTWSSFMALAMWLIAPYVAERPLEILLALAIVHLASLAFLVPFHRDPGQHEDEAHRAPPSYRVLLSGHRILLVASYVMMFTLSPFLPKLLAELDIPPQWRTPFGSVWMPARVAVFFLMGRWHGWHGRRLIAAIGATLLVVGFGLTVSAPALGGHVAGLAALVTGQIAFGVAIAALYTANLYYSFEVGESSVEAGGSHEGLIGLGYTIGPLFGWVAGGLAETGFLASGNVPLLVNVAIECLTVTGAFWAWRVTRPRRGSLAPSSIPGATERAK
jgi:hypothetical protein